jgi:hypothetical protein
VPGRPPRHKPLKQEHAKWSLQRQPSCWSLSWWQSSSPHSWLGTSIPEGDEGVEAALGFGRRGISFGTPSCRSLALRPARVVAVGVALADLPVAAVNE